MMLLSRSSRSFHHRRPALSYGPDLPGRTTIVLPGSATGGALGTRLIRREAR